MTLSPPWREVAPWVTTVARLGLATVFGYSGFNHLMHPQQTVVAVDAYQLVPESLLEVVAYGQPFLEAALALLLLAGFATRVVGAGTAVLLAVFIAAVSSAWARGLTIDCGCFSGGGNVAAGETHYLRVILRDAGLVVLAGWAVIFPPGRFALDTLFGAGEPAGGEATGEAAA